MVKDTVAESARGGDAGDRDAGDRGAGDRDAEERGLAGLVDVLRLLSEPTRVRILLLLAGRGPTCVNEICATLKVPQPTVSHHLGWLRAGSLVRTRRDGKQIYYALHACVQSERPAEGGQALRIGLPQFALKIETRAGGGGNSVAPAPGETPPGSPPVG